MELPTEFTFNTVPQMWKCKDEIFTKDSIDTQTIKKIDAAGVAFLVQWSKTLPQKKLRLLNTPQQVINLIDTYRVSVLFQIE
jgi:phospholipid transport system transporter-binding protein